MKRNVASNILAPKRDSQNSQPQKRNIPTPNVSIKQINSTAFENPKYSISEMTLHQRVNDLQSMYEAQITTLTSSLQEKDRFNVQLTRRVKEIQNEKLYLQKKMVEIMKEKIGLANSNYYEVANENRMLKNFIQTHIEDKMKMRATKLDKRSNSHGKNILNRDNSNQSLVFRREGTHLYRLDRTANQ